MGTEGDVGHRTLQTCGRYLIKATLSNPGEPAGGEVRAGGVLHNSSSLQGDRTFSVLPETLGDVLPVLVLCSGSVTGLRLGSTRALRVVQAPDSADQLCGVQPSEQT